MASHHHRDMQDDKTWLLGTWAKSPQMFLRPADSFPVSSSEGEPQRWARGKSTGQAHGLQPQARPTRMHPGVTILSGPAEKISNLNNSGICPAASTD